MLREKFDESLLKHKLVIMFLYYACLRLNEVRNLRWYDIDFDREVIHIKTAKVGKERILFLHPELKEMLKIHEINKEGLIFRSQKGRKYNKRTMQKIVEKSAEMAGIKKKTSPHTLRHSFAAHLLES